MRTPYASQFHAASIRRFALTLNHPLTQLRLRSARKADQAFTSLSPIEGERVRGAAQIRQMAATRLTSQFTGPIVRAMMIGIMTILDSHKRLALLVTVILALGQFTGSGSSQAGSLASGDEAPCAVHTQSDDAAAVSAASGNAAGDPPALPDRPMNSCTVPCGAACPGVSVVISSQSSAPSAVVTGVFEPAPSGFSLKSHQTDFLTPPPRV